MASGEVTITIVDAAAIESLIGLLVRMESGDVWSVDLAAVELRLILESLGAK